MPQSDKSSELRPQSSGVAEQPRTRDHTATEPSVSKPGGFKNDPDDAKNPNEAIERHRRKLRP